MGRQASAVPSQGWRTVRGVVPQLYGLDIETDTETGGLDPEYSAVVAVAVSGPNGSRVFDGDETDILIALDDHLRTISPGVLVTWNGSKFDLPFLDDRARRLDVTLGLRLALDPQMPLGRGPLAGHAGGYRGRWYRHGHLDAFRAFADIGGALAHSCSLKTMAKLFGLHPVQVDASRIHDLDRATLHAYVASDAEAARTLALMGLPDSLRYLDDVA